MRNLKVVIGCGQSSDKVLCLHIRMWGLYSNLIGLMDSLTHFVLRLNTYKYEETFITNKKVWEPKMVAIITEKFKLHNAEQFTNF